MITSARLADLWKSSLVTGVWPVWGATVETCSFHGDWSQRGRQPAVGHITGATHY